MMYSEFLDIANVTDNDITADTYDNIIEPMYMAINLSKYDFVKMLNIKEICDTYPNVNKTEKELVKLIAKMRKNLGLTTMHEEENKFIALAKQYCELKGMEYCYEEGIVYEIPLYERGCTMYTGFVARKGNAYLTYKIGKTVEICKSYVAA